MSEVKRVEIKGAGPRYEGDNEYPVNVEIAIGGYWPFSSKEELSLVDARLQAEAQALFEALRDSLPGGTLDRLVGLLLQYMATHFIVSHRKWEHEREPINMLLFCPNCGIQHIDEARPDVCETCGGSKAACVCSVFTAWLNPPHKSHRCESCNYVWRPADVPTSGVAALQTRGERDSDPIPRLTTGSLGSLMEELNIEQSALYANDSYVLGLSFALQRIGELAGINPDLKPEGGANETTS